ncbi:MAG: ATP-dependent DNA ligase, partial [Nitrososphaerales archaeon]
MDQNDKSPVELIVESSDFGQFARTCEAVRLTSSKLAKIRLVSDYFTLLKLDEDLRIASTFLSGKIFAPGAEEREINVGYSLIWKTVSQFHQLTDKQLSDFYLKHGDLGSAVQDYMTSVTLDRKSEGSSVLFESDDLTLQSVYTAFRELAKASGKGSTERRQRIMQRLFSSIEDPLEAKYLIRIIGGEMRIGLVEGLVEESIAKAFSKTQTQVRSTNLVLGDIGAVALLAKHDKLEEARIELFCPTNFMLAEPAENAEDLFKKFSEMPVISEYKYDGIRAQIHSRGGKVKIFSRNLEDVTRFFPEINDAVATINKQVMLDGEIVPFRDGRPLSFQALQQRLRKLERTDADVPVKFFAFDLLYLEKPTIQEKLSTRVEMLRSLEPHDALAFSKQRWVSTPREISAMFEESKSLGYEG